MVSLEDRGGREKGRAKDNHYLKWAFRRAQKTLWKGDFLSYPKSWSSSTSPSDLLHRSEGSWVLIFPSGSSALPIRALLSACEAPGRCCGEEERGAQLLLRLPLLSEPGACCGCESPSSEEVKLGYSSHWHCHPGPEALAGVFCQSGSMQTEVATWDTHTQGQQAVSVRDMEETTHLVSDIRPNYNFCLTLWASGV